MTLDVRLEVKNRIFSDYKKLFNCSLRAFDNNLYRSQQLKTIQTRIAHFQNTYRIVCGNEKIFNLAKCDLWLQIKSSMLA